jgi:hypothetical protein
MNSEVAGGSGGEETVMADDGVATAMPRADGSVLARVAAPDGTPAVTQAKPPDARRARLVLLVVSAACFMSNLDLFVVNVAFPDIHRDLGGGLSALSWVLNGYASSA